jgi:hypothetical protein
MIMKTKSAGGVALFLDAESRMILRKMASEMVVISSVHVARLGTTVDKTLYEGRQPAS